MVCIEEDEVYDVLIIGGGPCGLAMAARLREHTPDALFTDDEHRRFHWLNKYGRRVSVKHVVSGKTVRPPVSSDPRHRHHPDYKLAVLDSSAGDWLGRWRTLFAAYDIRHLRSPMIWHVDPNDRDSLLGAAWRAGRDDDMVQIPCCVGKELSKHAKKQKSRGEKAPGSKQSARVHINQRDSNDYYTPSQRLFVEHCQEVADRYRLDKDIVHHETVQDIDYGVVRGVSIDDEKLFTVTSGDSANPRRRYAKAVVLAVGPGNAPVIPDIPSMPSTRPLPQACHSMHIREYPDGPLKAKIEAGRRTNVLVVGGGLTSAQLADLAIRRGVTRVWLLMRSRLRLKAFDVDLEWMGKYKNAEHSRFLLADTDEERLAIIKEARGGGSVTPKFYKRIRPHLTSGQLQMRECTRVVDAKFEEGIDGIEGTGSWTIKTEPPIDNLPAFDHICFATGIQTDFATLPYLQTMLQKHPIKGFGGFPCVTEDLMWSGDVPLFMAGRLGSLQLGPAAPNIGGAKVGAERIALAIGDLVRPTGSEEWEADEDVELRGYLSGHGNMYSSLTALSTE